MTLSITFYNNVRYTKDDFMNRDRDFFGNGLVQKDHFQIAYPTPRDLSFAIGSGVAWVDGYRIANDSSAISLHVEPGGDLPRIDIVQIGHDDQNAKPVLEVKKGVPGSTPIERDPDAYCYKLYAINVPAGATSISEVNVLDRRGLVPLHVSGSQIMYDGVVGRLDIDNVYLGTQTAPSFIATSPTAPLKMPVLGGVPDVVGPAGTLCVVAGKWYLSDGTSWSAMSDAPATADELGSVKVGASLTLTTDGTIGATPASVGAVNLRGDTMTGSLTAPTFVSNVADGTAPLTVASSTNVTNFNADKLDGLHADDLIGQRIRSINPDTDQYYFIGTLPTSSDSTYEKLVVEIMGGPSYSREALTFDRVIMGNRDGFGYQFMQSGTDADKSRYALRVLAYIQSDDSVHVYLCASKAETAEGIVRIYGMGLGNSTTALTIGEPSSQQPTGIAVFDSALSAPNMEFSGGTLRVNSLTAPLRLPNLSSLPVTVAANGTVCLVKNKWYVSDGKSWMDMAPTLLPATADTLGGVKIGAGIHVAEDGTIDIDSTVLEPFRMEQINFINLALEVETMKKATLNGVTANVFVESFVDLNDITLLHGSYDSTNQKVYLA